MVVVVAVAAGDDADKDGDIVEMVAVSAARWPLPAAAIAEALEVVLCVVDDEWPTCAFP